MQEIISVIFYVAVAIYGIYLLKKFEDIAKDTSEIKIKVNNIEKIIYSIGSKYLAEWKEKEFEKIIKEDKK